jgi:ribosomal protein L32
MAKHPVPKQKQSKGRSSRRYKVFAGNARKKLANAANLLNCPKCSAPMKMHNVCKACGFYRGKDMMAKVQKAEAKVTKIKAE